MFSFLSKEGRVGLRLNKEGLNEIMSNHKGKLNTETYATEETRGKLYMWMKQVIRITQPKTFVAENIKNLVNLSNIKDIIQSDFSSTGNNAYLVLILVFYIQLMKVCTIVKRGSIFYWYQKFAQEIIFLVFFINRQSFVKIFVQLPSHYL